MAHSLQQMLAAPSVSVFDAAPRWADPDVMPQGFFVVSNSSKMPTTGTYLVHNMAGIDPASDTTAEVQIAISTLGVASVRYLQTSGWHAWAALGGGGSAYAHAPWWDAAAGVDPTLETYAGALGSDPPTTFQQAIDILAYYAAADIAAFRNQLGYLYGSNQPSQNLDHTVNPQTLVLAAYNIAVVTDGLGANPHNVVLPDGADLLQRVEIAPQFNHAGETVVIKPAGGGSGLMTAAGVSITTITVAGNNKQVLLEWVQSVKKWRLLDYTDTGVTIV